jgi:hypothetical protein
MKLFIIKIEPGELFGIKALVDHNFEKVVNLNDKKIN